MNNDLIQQKLLDFFSQYKKVSFLPKESISVKNNSKDYIYFLESGLVKQFAITEEGEQLNLNIFSPGAYFPMMMAMSNEKNHYLFESIDEVVAYKAPAEDVLKFVRENADIGFELAERFAKGLCKLLIKMETTLYQDSYSRVISLLLYLAEKFGEKSGKLTLISIPLTHADIASWVGIQRETASRQIEKLIAKKLVVQDGKKVLIDVVGLKKEKK